jgi:4-amino-4-deoxy-L-arabinose transferase-like glycosyltransferase
VSRFVRILLVIVAVAFAVRIGYVAVAKAGPCETNELGTLPTECALGDQLFYNAAANRLAMGDGFVEPFDFGSDPAPAADHPPLTAIVLAPVSWLADRPPLEWVGDPTHLTHHRYTMAVIGTGLVLLVGLLGRRVAGNRAGWVAAGIAAVTPNLWVNDGLVMSETVTGVAVVGALLLALRLAERPSTGGAVALGAVCGLAALARAELLAFVPLLALPFLRRHWRVATGVVVAAAAVLAPWVAFNVARFEEPVLLSTNDGIALAGSNCDGAYYGPAVGLTMINPPDACIDDPHPPGDQSEVARIYRERAFEYISDHQSRLPLVVAARVGRTWSLFRPLDMVTFNEGEGREPWTTRLGLVAYYPTLVGAVAGAVLLWRRHRRTELWVLAVPVITVTAGSAISYGQTRFRAAAEPSLAVLAAIALTALIPALQRVSARARTRGAPPQSARRPRGVRAS